MLNSLWWLARTLRDAAWAPMLVLAFHLIASKIFDAYSAWPDLDVPMHLIGGIASAYWFHTASLHGSACSVLGPFHRLTHCLLVIGLTCAAAMGWEFAEFLSDRYLGTRMQCGDLNDTLLDMFLGMVGGIAFLTAAWTRGRLKPSIPSPTGLPPADGHSAEPTAASIR